MNEAIVSSLVYGSRNLPQPFLSIVIPTYRRPRLLGEALKSALSQTVSAPCEVVVVDDDELPGVLDVIKHFPADRFAVYQNSNNLGLWGNMNRALELSRGEWVLFLLDDDLLLPGSMSDFERLLAGCGSREIGCLVGGSQLLLDGTARPLLNLHKPLVRYPVAFNVSPATNKEVVPVIKELALVDVPKLCSSFFRRADLLQLGGWDPECEGFADVAVYLRFQREGKLFACNTVFGCFRVHDGNLSRPEKLWQTYPVPAARRLLTDYVEEGTAVGKSIRTMLESTYISALWKRPMTKEVRRKRAEEVLSSVVQDPWRKFLLRRARLLSAMAWLYAKMRPTLGQISLFVFGSPREHRESLRIDGTSPVRMD